MEWDKPNLQESMGSAVKNTAGSAAPSAGRISERVGEALDSMGDSLRQNVPGSDKISEAAETISRRVKQTADYVHEQGMGGIVEDLEILIRRYPLQTLLLGMGCGYLLSRLRPD